ncbi:glutamate-cysteine ligase family protein [Pseudonocardia abyssalis]|uniref:Glutamate--cysteine ligase EgtA n=1 Tax=Pseudonocardia abyssalis TaxID=2792008 RepID=A0ABS6URI7_9PSEU|nr:glutamate-cysteine ligase family protein [Pseudonocardia abyssalis]MBW0113734.1 glutamate--cysteine ligase [Pseudonocardia abyssalis]MBW0134807.1 glutamate--cysteine ligase [Pseudonocardia abyssalis]
MPSQRRALARATAVDIAAASFIGEPPSLCGIELEWPVHRYDDVGTRPTHPELLAAAQGPLPHGGRVTIEPGGQIELSTLPAATADATLDAATMDSTTLHERLRRAGLVTAELAVDTRRSPHRILTAARYACMEEFFSSTGDAGSWMMCNTASLQVNLSHLAVDPQRRWKLAHQLGPILIAAFAHSPGLDAAGRRWESMRQAIWWSIDPGRTRPPCLRTAGPDAWLHYAMCADVMLMRSADASTAVPIAPGLPFGRWLAEGHEGTWPTVEDLRYHLTTLFPPIRPRGWLELRMLDLLPTRLRDVATVVVLAALTTPAADELEERLPSTEGLWCASARYAMGHPALANAARTLFDTVLPAVEAVTTSAGRRDDVGAFAQEYIARAMSPAQRVGSRELGSAFAPSLSFDRATQHALAG